MICRTGSASIRVNFSMWKLCAGSVLTLFPNDMVTLTERSEDFSVEVLEYNATLLREASLQMEQTVYSQLRADRCRTESPIVTNIINDMFSLLKIYFDQPECMCLDQLVLLQLKAFFVGFYDYIYRFPQKRKTRRGQSEGKGTFQSLHDVSRDSFQGFARCDILCLTAEHHSKISQHYSAADNGQHCEGADKRICCYATEAIALLRQHVDEDVGW